METTRTRAAKRAEQQAAVADLGLLALTKIDLDTLMATAVAKVQDTLGVELVKVLERHPDGRSLLLRSGVGWHDGLVGEATVGTECSSQAGFTLLSDDSVVVDDLTRETRFTGPALLTDHGVVSGLSVPIRGKDESYGVLGAHTRTPRSFDRHEVDFVRAVANVLAQAIEHHRTDQALRRANEELEQRVAEATEELRLSNHRLGEQEAFLRSIYNEVALAIYTIDVEGNGFIYRDVNPTFTRMTGVPRAKVIGKRPEELDHLSAAAAEKTNGQYRHCVETSKILSYETHVPTPSGDAWWLVTINPVHDTNGAVYRLIGTAVPIGERKQIEAELRAARRRLAGIQEEERLALARALHDDVIQQLLSLNQAFSRMLKDDHADLETIMRHRTELQGLVQRLRRRISDLRPAGLEELGLVPTLEGFVAQLQAESRDGPVLTSELGDGTGLSAEAARTLFKVAQEAIRNALRHAEAAEIKVELLKRHGWVELTVIDDGSGFEAPERLSSLVIEGHYGLLGIEERVNLLGGKLAIDAILGHGTTVRASVRTDADLDPEMTRG